MKRIIPCLDVYNGRVVKGTKFVDLQDAGDPAELAERYCHQGADELVFLDITATTENRGTMIDLVRRTVERCTVPLTVGGGIRSVEDIQAILDAGAARVGINSAAVTNPNLVSEASKTFGSDRVVVAIDAKKRPDGSGWDVRTRGGQTSVGRDVIEWAKEVRERGAGEILPTSVDTDGTKGGYDVELTAAIADATDLPVIASGGAGNLDHMVDVLTRGKADAVLAARIFHFGEYTVGEVKKYLSERGIPVRL